MIVVAKSNPSTKSLSVDNFNSSFILIYSSGFSATLPAVGTGFSCADFTLRLLALELWTFSAKFVSSAVTLK